jgi:rubrerythrin
MVRGGKMKRLNGILELIGITALLFILVTATFQYVDDVWWKVGILIAGAVLIVLLYILSTKYEKRLESELETFKMIALEKSNKLKELNLLLEEQSYTIKQREAQIDELHDQYEKLSIDFANQVETIRELNVKVENLFAPEIPFAEEVIDKEEIYLCKECGSANVRETAKMIICNECSKRRKK